jgi:hypothetical protein
MSEEQTQLELPTEKVTDDLAAALKQCEEAVEGTATTHWQSFVETLHVREEEAHEELASANGKEITKLQSEVEVLRGSRRPGWRAGQNLPVDAETIPDVFRGRWPVRRLCERDLLILERQGRCNKKEERQVMKSATLVAAFLLTFTGCWTIPGYEPPGPSTMPAFIGLKVDVNALYTGNGLSKDNQSGVDSVAQKIKSLAATVNSTEKSTQLEAIATLLTRHAKEFQTDDARGRPWSAGLAKEKAANISEMFRYVERMGARH